MRKKIAEFIRKDEYLLHADMFNTTRFPIKGIEVNVGLREATLLNVAGGLASQKNTVWVYGVAGFIIHRIEQLKFSCVQFGAKKGKIIIFNAGKIGYENLGPGHRLDDDRELMSIYNIPFYEPENLEELSFILDGIRNKSNGIFYIKLGKDIS